MAIQERIISLSEIGKLIESYLTDKNTDSPTNQEFESIVKKAEIQNPWFTQKNIKTALYSWKNILCSDKISRWLSAYDLNNLPSKKIGLILAGNIPMVGLHDCLTVLLLGQEAKIKLSSKDSVIIPFLLNLWKEFCEELHFEFVDKLEDYDAVITTGSDNSARYFEYYFNKVPNIIRKNRTSVAVISGKETDEELENLTNDIFTYFGLGCRNVTQLLIPEDFEVDKIFNAFMKYKDIIYHNKYANNYDYHKAIFLLNEDKFWDNNFVLLREEDSLFSPLGVLFFKRIPWEEIPVFLKNNEEKLQCIVSNSEIETFRPLPFGKTQQPDWHQYADGADTVKFILSL